jgi:hypothetical protein
LDIFFVQFLLPFFQFGMKKREFVTLSLYNWLHNMNHYIVRFFNYNFSLSFFVICINVLAYVSSYYLVLFKQNLMKCIFKLYFIWIPFEYHLSLIYHFITHFSFCHSFLGPVGAYMWHIWIIMSSACEYTWNTS